MRAIIQTEFKIRDQDHTAYYSFPKYSDEIESTMIRELEFLQRLGNDYSLTLTIKGPS
jgi:hypothetical protein